MKRLDPVARDMRIGRGADHLDLRVGDSKVESSCRISDIVDDENAYGESVQALVFFPQKS